MSEAAGGAPAPSSSPAPSNTGPNTGTPNTGDGPNTGKSTSTQTPGTQAPPEMFEVKVNGRTVKMSRQEVLEHASLSHAANQKFDEAAKMRKEFEESKNKYSKDPLKAFLDFAKDLPPAEKRKALEEFYMREYIEPENMTAEQKKLKEYELKVQEYEAREKEKAEKDEMDKTSKLVEQQREYLQNQIIEALETSNLPKSKDTVKRIAFYMRQNLLNGWDAPMDMIIRQVKNERQSSIRDEIQTSSAEQILELLGEDVVNKIRRYDLQKLRDSRQSPPVVTNRPNAGTGKIENEGRLNSRDVNERLRALRMGKIPT